MLALAVAGWMRWQSGRTLGGKRFTVDVPLAEITAHALAGASDDAARIDALLAVGATFPAGLAENPIFRTSLIAAYPTPGGRCTVLGSVLGTVLGVARQIVIRLVQRRQWLLRAAMQARTGFQ